MNGEITTLDLIIGLSCNLVFLKNNYSQYQSELNTPQIKPTNQVKLFWIRSRRLIWYRSVTDPFYDSRLIL